VIHQLTVLGGGGPFSVGLIDALCADLSVPPHQLVLHGRGRETLDLVRQYAAARLEPIGWQVAASTDLYQALTGSHYVIHQIRYGGIEGRAEDEQLASNCGVVADETLGLGALNSALRMVPPLRTVAAAISAAAPDAWVLNLTNPLSIATSILAEEGVKRCVGVCELPSATAQLVAEVLDLPLERLDWHYRGLNHRGFIIRLMCDGVDQLPLLLDRLGDRSLGGIPAAVIAELGAVPTKYFGLLQRGHHAAARAEFVGTLRDRIVRELQADPRQPPPSLKLRRLDWYRESVVPLLAALHGSQPRRAVVNLHGEDGLTRELHASVSAQGIIPEDPLDPPPRVGDYLARFDEHERRVLEAVTSPSLATISAAAAADPTLEQAESPALAQVLWKRRSAPEVRAQPVGT
jgi:6-phospho-beta-glucosidase